MPRAGGEYMNNGQNNNFSYTYSAKEQAEIKKIREKYAAPTEDKMEQLRRLDKSVTKKGTRWSVTVGIVGIIVMGSGMSVCMAGSSEYFAWGVIVGFIGMATAAVAYPLYAHITKKQREKIAPEVIRLTDELIK